MNRRDALRSLAASAAAGATASALVPSFASAGTATVLNLFRMFLLARAEADRAYLALEDTRFAMPAWAAPGLSHIDAAGRRCGNEVGWPEVIGADDKAPGVGRVLIRPNLKQVWDLGPIWGIPGSKQRAHDLARRRARVRRHIARLREQQREEEAVGLPALDAAVRHADAVVEDLTNRIVALRDATGCPNYVGAVMLMEWSTDHSALSGLEPALRSIAHGATGCVRDEALRVLATLEPATTAPPARAA